MGPWLTLGHDAMFKHPFRKACLAELTPQWQYDSLLDPVPVTRLLGPQDSSATVHLTGSGGRPGASKGFCYVNYSSREAAAAALDTLNGIEWPPASGARIKVRAAAAGCIRKHPTPLPGRN